MPFSGPVLVAIAGGSGSGKSWLAERLALSLKPLTTRLSIDDFYLDRSYLSPARRSRINFDHPRAIDWRRFQQVLRKLRAGEVASIPRYDFHTHCRLKSEKRLKPNRVVLVEGLWALRSAAVRKFFDLRIFLECTTPTRLRRRLARDLVARGRTAASVRKQFRKMVEPMHCKHVTPQKRWADVVLREGWGKGEVEVLSALVRTLTRRQVLSARRL